MDAARRFDDLVRAGRTLNYSTRCRLIADEVSRQHDALADSAHPSTGSAQWAWLESELSAAAAAPGTVAELVRARAASDQRAAGSASDLRVWLWERIATPRDARWGRRAESRSMWSLLMSPLPADEAELALLATSNGLDVNRLRRLLAPVAVAGTAREASS